MRFQMIMFHLNTKKKGLIFCSNQFCTNQNILISQMKNELPWTQRLAKEQTRTMTTITTKLLLLKWIKNALKLEILFSGNFFHYNHLFFMKKKKQKPFLNCICCIWKIAIKCSLYQCRNMQFHSDKQMVKSLPVTTATYTAVILHLHSIIFKMK